MATLNEILQPERMTISDISSKFGDDEIYIDDTFQRRSVWVLKNKIRLIESVLVGYPMPEIYFWQGSPNSDTGKIRMSVVDGQQRIRAINEYVSGEYKLSRNSLNPENRELEFVNKYFNELDGVTKNKIWNYRLNIRILPSSLSRDEIIAVFLRLNETDKSLNPQELRNAKFNGKFIKAAEEVANLDFWAKWGVFSPSMIRRMNDILISSQFLAFLRNGIDGDVTPKAINELYDRFNDNYREKKVDVQSCESTLEFVDAIFERNEYVAKFFKIQTHFYPLFIASYMYVQRNEKSNFDLIAKRLLAFSRAYRDNDDDTDQLIRYRLASNEGMLKKSNRELRVKAVLAVMEGHDV